MKASSVPRQTSQPDFLVRQVENSRYFFLNLKPGRPHDLVVVGGGCERCLPAYQVTRTTFRFLSLEIVAEGRGRFDSGLADDSLRPGSVFLYGPGIPHRISNDPTRCMLKYFFDFTGREAFRLLEKAGLRLGECFQVAELRHILDVGDRLIEDAGRRTGLTSSIAAAYLELLILLCAANRRSEPGHTSKAWATYVRVRRDIDEHFMTLHSLADVSRRCGLAAPSICRLFKLFDTETPYQRLLRLKMNRAGQHIASGMKLVKEVASDMGYDDPYHFSRLFKKIHGVPPEQFRRLSVRMD